MSSGTYTVDEDARESSASSRDLHRPRGLKPLTGCPCESLAPGGEAMSRSAPSKCHRKMSIKAGGGRNGTYTGQMLGCPWWRCGGRRTQNWG